MPSDYYGPPISLGNRMYRPRLADDPPPTPEELAEWERSRKGEVG